MIYFRHRLYKRLRNWFARRFGMDLVPLHGHETLSSHLRQALCSYRIDCVLDVGANEGQFALELREFGYRGAIFSFEPVKASFEKLQEAARGDLKWNIFNVALGESVGNALIKVYAQPVFSSLLSANQWGADRFVGLKTSHEEEIAITTLDLFLASHDVPPDARILLKMDTQGYDPKVFKGARQSLHRICCMVSELSLIPIYEGMPDYAEALEVYAEGGFAPSGFYPVSRNQDLSLVEVDCVLVRREAFNGAS
jgi:FkbM family methyltransferase